MVPELEEGTVKRNRSLSLGIFLWVLILGLLSTDVDEVGAQEPNRVGLIVNMGAGNVLTRCVEFAEPEISGYDVLARAGLQVVRRAEGLGGIVCSIQDVGCPVDNCFCQCSGSTCTYWSYWHLAGGQWSYSTLGADAHTVRNGDVEGWNWGQEEPPPLVPFDQICVPPATATPEPTATDTPLPPPRVEVGVSPTTIVAGQCAELRWEVEYVQAVYLDGRGVGGQGTRSVCPAQSQTYELRVVSASGESRHPVTVNVVQPTPTSTLTPTVPPVPTATAVRVQATATSAPTAAPTGTPSPSTELPTETPAPTVTPTLTMTATPTATSTATVTPTPTVTNTPTPRPVAQLPRSSPTAVNVLAERLSPTPDSGLAAPGTGRAGAEEATNYVLFGVLMAVLLGVGAVVLIQRRR
jgi:hypothetical protein